MPTVSVNATSTQLPGASSDAVVRNMIAGKIQKPSRLNGATIISPKVTPRAVLSVTGKSCVMAHKPQMKPGTMIIAIMNCQVTAAVS